MNKVQTALVFSAMLAVTIGALSYSGISATSLATTSLPRNSDAMNVLGHVEYTVRDSSGLVKAYYQSDNLVVNTGDNCVAARLFDPGSSSGLVNHGCSNFGSTGYQFIAIGNQTAQFDDASTNLIAAATASVDGEMARERDTTPLFTASSGNSTTGAQVIIETPTPFTFSASNATTVKNSALFNATATTDSNGQTTAITGSSAFAIQKLNPTVTVSNGDTLNVRWTITIGGGDAQSGP